MQRWRHVAARQPLACLAVAAWMGIVFADGLAWPVIRHLCWVMALIFAVSAWRRPIAWRLVLTTFFAFGFVHACRLDATRLHVLTTVLERGQRVDVIATGTFTRAPMVVDNSSAPTRREARFLAQHIVIPSRQKSVTGITDLRLWLKDETFVPNGGVYELHGTLSLPARAVNPSLFNPERGALQQGIVADMMPRELKQVGAPRWSLWLSMLKLAEQSRIWIANTVEQGVQNDDMARILIQTMALGTSEAGSADLQEPFRNSGTLHIFAVSGLHVSLFAVIGWWMLKPMGFRKGIALGMLIPMVVGYAFITGWRPSAARAAFMTVALLCAPMISRRGRLINVLGGAALILWASDTLQLFQAGFQLSFGVLWAIAVGAPIIGRPFASWAELDPFLPPPLAGWRDNLSVWWRRELVAMLATSTAAWIGSLPLMIMQFHSVTPIAILANCVLVPLAFFSLFAVALSLVAACVQLPAMLALLNNANLFFAHAMMVSATWFSSIPGGNFGFSLPTWHAAPPVSMSVLAMPPGEGAQMLESGGQRWLLDCGSAQHENTAILPFLKQHGISRIDGVMLSHADSEHIGAMSAVMRRYHPPQLMMSMLEPWRLDSRISTMHQLFDNGVFNGAKITKLAAGDSLTLGNTQVRVLYPAADDLYNKSDDRAMVVRLDCGQMRVLWCNDAGFITEKHLLQRFSADELHSHILVRNQHSDDLSAMPEFVLAVNPRAVVSSNFPGIQEQRLPYHLKQICEERQIRLFDQSQTGMVALDIWPDHIEAKAWLTGEAVTIQP